MGNEPTTNDQKSMGMSREETNGSFTPLRLKDRKMKDSKALLLEYLSSIRDPETRCVAFLRTNGNVRSCRFLRFARGRTSLHGPPGDRRASFRQLASNSIRTSRFAPGRYPCPHRDAGKKDVSPSMWRTARAAATGANSPPSVHWIPGGRGWSRSSCWRRDLQSACDGNRRKLPNGGRRYQTAPATRCTRSDRVRNCGDNHHETYNEKEE